MKTVYDQTHYIGYRRNGAGFQCCEVCDDVNVISGILSLVNTIMHL